jgi:hypothetical protein
MPFDESFDELYQEVLKECLEESNFNVIRVDELYGSKPIMEDILNRIESSEIVVADLTGRNPNVFYELGIAHCRKANDNLVIITQDLDDVPFDLKPYRIIQYKPTISGAKALRKQLKNTIMEFRLKSFTWASHEWQPVTEYWCTYDDGDTLRAEIFRRGQIPLVFNRTQINETTTSISFTAQSTRPEINVMFYCDGKNRYSGYHFWFWQGGAKLRRLDNEVKLETGYKLRQDTQYDIIIKYNNGDIEVLVDKNSVLSFSDENPLHENKRLKFMGFNIASSRIGHVNFYGLEISHD